MQSDSQAIRQNKPKRLLRGQLPAVILLLLGVAITYFVFEMMREADRHHVETNFAKLTDQRVLAIRRHLDREMLLLESIRGLFNSSQQVEPGEFQRFVRPFSTSALSAKVFAWAPMVSNEERNDFEAMLRQEKIAESILQSDAGDAMTPAAQSKLYFPILYLEPKSDIPLVPGYDLQSNYRFTKLNEIAQGSSNIRVSEGFKSHKAPVEAHHVLISAPVYYKPATVEPFANEGRLQGFVATAFKVTDFIENALDILTPAGIDIRIYDGMEAEERKLLAVYSARISDRDKPIAGREADNFSAQLSREVVLQIADRKWSLLLTSAPGQFRTGTSARSAWVLGIGLLFTGLLFVYLRSLQIRDLKLEHTNEQLNREISDRKQAEQGLIRARDFYLTLFEDLPNLIWRSDINGKCDYFNKAWLEFTGRSLLEVLGDGWSKAVHPEDLGKFRKLAYAALKARKPFEIEFRLEHKTGDYRWVSAFGQPYTDLDGNFSGYLGSCLDISQHMAAEEGLKEANLELQRLSLQDGLTGIANRRSFDQYIEREWVRAARCADRLSLIILDLDYFKEYNDCYGHVAGDQCLQQVAAALEEVFERPADLVARYGGEEIAIVLPETDTDGVVSKAEQVMQTFKRLHIDHERSQVADHLTVSLGIGTTVPHPKVPVKVFIDAVDKALYKAKRLGRNQVAVADSISLEDLLKASV